MHIFKFSASLSEINCDFGTPRKTIRFDDKELDNNFHVPRSNQIHQQWTTFSQLTFFSFGLFLLHLCNNNFFSFSFIIFLCQPSQLGL